jgi:methylated-DNA-protein-cysteine methyltransferase-like protein
MSRQAESKSGSNAAKQRAIEGATLDQRIWLTVCAIPRGRVATYGDIARRAGLPGAARRVGAALRKLPEGSGVPWHRVVNASGRSSLPPGAQGEDRQLALLAEEGVLLGSGGRATLERYRWR